MTVAFRAQSVSAEQSIYDQFNLPHENLWVFGYGSLMWDPGFPYLEAQRARIFGFHRALCIRSVRYRGTHELPGLVFGLDRGGSCTGMGFQTDPINQREIADYLQDREMLNDIYEPSIRSIVLDDGRKVPALTFVVKRHHTSYIKNLNAHEIARIVARAKGQRGANIDYVLSTLSTLESIGIRDQELHRVGKLASIHVDQRVVSNDG